MIKAIETVYSGYRFRSRLEARWAVFFDTLGIPYEYEPDGFPLHGKWYLPDFWLPDLDCWVEIKGQEPTKDEIQKAKLLAWYTLKSVYIFFGSVWHQNSYKDKNFSSAYLYGFLVFCFDYGYKDDEVVSYTELAKRFTAHDICTKTIGEVNKNLQKFMDRNQIGAVNDVLDCCWWLECPKCHKFGLGLYGDPLYSNACQCISEKDDIKLRSMCSTTPRILAAYTAARQARFEHGESGRR